MTTTDKFWLKTPRGTFPIRIIYDSEAEAREAGWGYWFTHENYDIYCHDNRVGAVVTREPYA